MKTPNSISLPGLTLAALIVAGAALIAPRLSAQPATIKVGTLTCSGSGGIGLILGSQKNMSCNFQPAGDAPPEPYGATLTKIGLDIGITGPTTMIWTVLATTNQIGPRALAGNYVGASADASLGIGGGAKLLVGGLDNAISLQPLSLQGQSGINLAVGVAQFELR